MESQSLQILCLLLFLKRRYGFCRIKKTEVKEDWMTALCIQSPAAASFAGTAVIFKSENHKFSVL